MNWELFWFVVIGGFNVILSYAWYALSSSSAFSLAALQGPFTGLAFDLWTISAVLTIFSYCYLTILFIGEEDVGIEPLTQTQKSVIYTTYTLFLGSASQYTYLATIDLFNRKKSRFLQFNLYLVAIGSVGFVWTVLLAEKVEPLMLVTSIYLVFHHLVLDAYFWYNAFDPKNVYGSIDLNNSDRPEL